MIKKTRYCDVCKQLIGDSEKEKYAAVDITLYGYTYAGPYIQWADEPPCARNRTEVCMPCLRTLLPPNLRDVYLPYTTKGIE